MNAAEAKQKALSVREGRNREQLEGIQRKIEEAVKAAQLCATVDYSLLSAVRSKLEEEGYLVTVSSHRNETSTTISWA